MKPVQFVKPLNSSVSIRAAAKSYDLAPVLCCFFAHVTGSLNQQGVQPKQVARITHCFSKQSGFFNQLGTEFFKAAFSVNIKMFPITRGVAVGNILAGMQDVKNDDFFFVDLNVEN